MKYRMPIMFMLGVTPIVAGVDFLLGEDSNNLSEIESALHPRIWGLILIAIGSLIVWGYVFRWPRVCIVGMYLSGAIFFVLGVGIAAQTIGSLGGFRSPWFYFVVAIASWLSALGYYDQLKGIRLEKEDQEKIKNDSN